MTRASSDTRVATIWSTYGDYHVARINALAEHGFDVVPFAHCDFHPTYPFFRAKPEGLVVINRGGGDQINPLLSLGRTWHLLRDYRPDIVLTAGYERTESLAAWLYARTSRGWRGHRPVAIVMTDNRSEDHPRSQLVERVKSVYVRVFDGFLASGSDTRDYLEGLGVSPSRIELGSDCVDNERIATLVASYRAASKDPNRRAGYFLCVARLVAKKNVSGVVSAYHSYLRTLPDTESPTRLVICGDGPERVPIERLIQRLGLGNSVTLLGEVVGLEAVAEQLAGCKALVLASTFDETWGLAVNEAMAAGCPVLVSKQCGCARDLVEHRANGLTFDGADPDELARHMVWVHTNEGLLESMGKRSKEIIAGFTTARFVASASKLALSAGVSTSGDPVSQARASADRGQSGKRVVTIWSTYGDPHVARVEALIRAGFEVDSFAHCDHEATYPFFQAKPQGLVVVNRGSGDRINPLLSFWRTWRLLRIHQPDIVLTSGYERTESLAAVIYAHTSRARKDRRPIVIVMLNNRAEDHPRKLTRERIKSAYLRVFDGFLASGSDTRDYLQQLGVAASRIELGCNCVDNDRIAGLVARYQRMDPEMPPQDRYFLCVARLVAKKNIPGILRAYDSYRRRLISPEHPSPLVICGDGPERSTVESLIQKLGLVNSVSLVGEAGGTEAVAKLLAGSKALVLASTRDETWGLAVNEALAAGRPVLVSKQCGCARDLVQNGVNGFVFDGEDPEELADHMLWTNANEGRLGAMGKSSVEIVRGFTTSRFAASVSKLAMSGSDRR